MRFSLTVKVFRLAIRDLLRKKGEAKMLNVGDPAPDFTVKTDRGDAVRLSDQKGKSIVLWFYPKADTPG
jgi:peroxiredoxin Q/BCP